MRKTTITLRFIKMWCLFSHQKTNFHNGMLKLLMKIWTSSESGYLPSNFARKVDIIKIFQFRYNRLSRNFSHSHRVKEGTSSFIFYFFEKSVTLNYLHITLKFTLHTKRVNVLYGITINFT